MNGQATRKNCPINLISSLRTQKYKDQKSKFFHQNLKNSIISELKNSICTQILNYLII